MHAWCGRCPATTKQSACNINPWHLMDTFRCDMTRLKRTLHSAWHDLVHGIYIICDPGPGYNKHILCVACSGYMEFARSATLATPGFEVCMDCTSWPGLGALSTGGAPRIRREWWHGCAVKVTLESRCQHVGCSLGQHGKLWVMGDVSQIHPSCLLVSVKIEWVRLALSACDCKSNLSTCRLLRCS